MQIKTDYDPTTSRFQQFADELLAGCDSDFDTVYGDIERELQEYCLVATASDGR